MRRVVAIGLFLLVLAPSLSQADVTLSFSWSKNLEADLAGYRLYRSTVSGQYGAPLATIVGQTTYTSTIPQTDLAKTYYHVLTAIDKSGNESKRTAEIVRTIPALTSTGTSVPPPPPPAVGLTVLSATPDEVVITAPKSACPSVLTSTKGTTATTLKRTVRCVR